MKRVSSLLLEYRDVIEVYYSTVANQTTEIYVHSPLEHSSSVYKSKGNSSVSEGSPPGPECHF